MNIQVPISRMWEGGTRGLVYLPEHTSACKLFLIRVQAKQVSEERNLENNNFLKTPLVIVLSLYNLLGNLGKTHLDAQIPLA